MTQLVYKRNFKRYRLVRHLESFPKCIARLAHERCFTVRSSDCYGFQCQEKIYDSESSKTIRMKSFSDNFTFETDDEAMRPEVTFKGHNRLYALCCKKQCHNIFLYIFQFGVEIVQQATTCWGKRLKGYAGIEGQFTNLTLCATTATWGLQKGIPDKFVMERTKHRDVRSLQKYQRSDTSSKFEILKKFDCCEAVSLPESVTSEKGVNKT